MGATCAFRPNSGDGGIDNGLRGGDTAPPGPAGPPGVGVVVVVVVVTE